MKMAAMTHRPMALGLALIGLFSVSLSGCGSGATGSGSSGAAHHLSWASEANRLCRATLLQRERLGRVLITTYDKVVGQMVRNERLLATRLRALEVPKREKTAAKRLIRLLDRQARETSGAMKAYGVAGQFLAYEAHVRSAQRLTRTIALIAKSSGVDACAQTPIRTHYL
jgi:hypothetical protein